MLLSFIEALRIEYLGSNSVKLNFHKIFDSQKVKLGKILRKYGKIGLLRPIFSYLFARHFDYADSIDRV